MQPPFSQHFVNESAVELLTQIHEECFPKYWNREAFTDFFSVANTFASLMQSGTEAAGMLVYRIAFDQADIITLAIRPKFRRHGLAKALMERSLEHCKELGAEKMLLEVEDGNEAALKLYESLGFSHIGRRKLYYQQLNGSLTDALVMRKKLS